MVEKVREKLRVLSGIAAKTVFFRDFGIFGEFFMLKGRESGRRACGCSLQNSYYWVFFNLSIYAVYIISEIALDGSSSNIITH